MHEIPKFYELLTKLKTKINQIPTGLSLFPKINLPDITQINVDNSFELTTNFENLPLTLLEFYRLLIDLKGKNVSKKEIINSINRKIKECNELLRLTNLKQEWEVLKSKVKEFKLFVGQPRSEISLHLDKILVNSLSPNNYLVEKDYVEYYGLGRGIPFEFIMPSGETLKEFLNEIIVKCTLFLSLIENNHNLNFDERAVSQISNFVPKTSIALEKNKNGIPIYLIAAARTEFHFLDNALRMLDDEMEKLFQIV